MASARYIEAYDLKKILSQSFEKCCVSKKFIIKSDRTEHSITDMVHFALAGANIRARAIDLHHFEVTSSLLTRENLRTGRQRIPVVLTGNSSLARKHLTLNEAKDHHQTFREDAYNSYE